MQPDEVEEYQQTEIDEAKDAVTERLQHVTGPWGHGLLDGERLNEHQNDRAEAYLEGYADALDFAEHRIDAIDNLVRYVDADPDEPWPVIGQLLRLLWGSNPQGAIDELTIEVVLEKVRNHYGDEQAERAIEAAGYTEYFEDEGRTDAQ